MSKVVMFIQTILLLFGSISMITNAISNNEVIDMCVGGLFSCAAFGSGKVKCWGDSVYWGSLAGPIGDEPSEVYDGIPYLNISATATVEKVKCGNEHMCVQLSTGDMKCLGNNHNGRIGIGVYYDISPIGEATGYTGESLPVVNLGTGLQTLDIALGVAHTCVRVTGNKVKCFGDNTFGTLGYGDIVERGNYENQMGDALPFVSFGTNIEVASVHSGPQALHSCAIFSAPVSHAQRVRCWGINNNYQLGLDTSLQSYGDTSLIKPEVLFDVNIGVESRVKQLVIGGFHTCVILINDKLACWGRGEHGVLGTGNDNLITGNGIDNLIIPIDSGKGVKLLSAGSTHTCIVYDDEVTMKCVGTNECGQMGQNDQMTRGWSPEYMIPVIPAIDLGTGSLNIKSISSGYYANCVLFVDSSIKCFGNGNVGQLGIGSNENRGDEENEMGTNLEFAKIVAPTKSPTMSPVFPTNSPTIPTKSPTSAPITDAPTSTPSTSPSLRPTNSPSSVPTTSLPTFAPSTLVPTTLGPTFNPSVSPTNSPTSKPNNAPTKAPTSSTPTKAPVSSAPTKIPTLNPTTLVPTKAPIANPTKNPTDSPIKIPDVYIPPKADCYQYTERAKCIAETNSECGTCAYYSDKVLYGFRVRVSFVMEKGVRFIDFDNVNANPPKTAFKDAVKAVVKSVLNGQDKIVINRIGQIYQTLGVDSGWADFEFFFIESDSDRVQTKAFLTSKPDLYDYIDDLNLQLNKRMKTTGKNYITGKINIDRLNIVDLAPGKGSCGCNEQSTSSANKSQWNVMITGAFSMLIAFLLN